MSKVERKALLYNKNRDTGFFTVFFYTCINNCGEK